MRTPALFDAKITSKFKVYPHGHEGLSQREQWGSVFHDFVKSASAHAQWFSLVRQLRKLLLT